MRYFFDILYKHRYPDPQGRVLDGDGAAFEHAMAVAEDFATRFPEKASGAHVVLKDELGRLLAVLSCIPAAGASHRSE